MSVVEALWLNYHRLCLVLGKARRWRKKKVAEPQPDIIGNTAEMRRLFHQNAKITWTRRLLLVGEAIFVLLILTLGIVWLLAWRSLLSRLTDGHSDIDTLFWASLAVFATGGLWWATYRLAQETRKNRIESEQPVLVADVVAEAHPGGGYRFSLRNVGSAPAFDVEAHLELGITDRPAGSDPNDTSLNRSFYTIAHGESVGLRLPASALILIVMTSYRNAHGQNYAYMAIVGLRKGLDKRCLRETGTLQIKSTTRKLLERTEPLGAPVDLAQRARQILITCTAWGVAVHSLEDD